MKKLSLLVLLGLTLTALTGCNNAGDNGGTTPPPADTNAAPAAPSTNAPAANP